MRRPKLTAIALAAPLCLAGCGGGSQANEAAPSRARLETMPDVVGAPALAAVTRLAEGGYAVATQGSVTPRTPGARVCATVPRAGAGLQHAKDVVLVLSRRC